MKADLHIHTRASDGRFSPAQIIQKAVNAGLDYIAITDHDTLDGIRQVNHPANDKIKVIAGIEFSTDLPEREVHILGYNIDIHNIRLEQQLSLLKQARKERAEKMIKKLNKLGYMLDYAYVAGLAGPSASIGRPHIAKALIEKGYFHEIAEVFDTLLAKNSPAYVPHYKMTPDQAIRLIRQAGGVAILAHPGLIKDENLIRELVENSLDGIEVYHPSHTLADTEQYLHIAKNNGLLITGGSDFHGVPGRYPEELGVFSVDGCLAVQLAKSQGKQALNCK